MRRHRQVRTFTKLSAAIVVALAAGACGVFSGPPPAQREPGFKTDAVRRPAVFVRVSISQDFEERERGRIASEYQGAVEEALNRLGLLPVDTAFATGAGQSPLEGLDRVRPLARARETGAEHLLIVDARLARGRVTLCRESKQSRSGTAAFWEAGLEIRRAGDGQVLLVEPGEAPAVEVDIDCRTGQVTRRKSMDVMIEESVGAVLAPFGRR